ncbi:uncharacterized protein LOC126832528 isoform X2 [Patella vulgata]|nr:uncharacterized protein LOC126832528 isoform X2 [Patella vulgata]
MGLDEFIEQLTFIPSFFTLDTSSLQTSKLQTMKVKMDEQEQNKFTETVNNNLASFLSFLYKDFGACETKNLCVLEKNPRNIQGNVMKAVLYCQMDRPSAAQNEFTKLKELSEDDYLMTEAKAENAYAYSRMGPEYYKKATELFDDVIQKYPEQYAWKYRMALTIRRRQHPGVLGLLPASDPVENFHKAKQIFEDIIENGDDKVLKALSFIGLAYLHYGYCAEKITLSDMELKTEEAVEAKAIGYLNKAEQLAGDDQKVLTETGRLRRKLKQLQPAREVLEKAMEIQPTTICCHHLALTIRDIDGYTPLVVDYLTQAVELSEGLNQPAMEELGIAHMKSGEPDYDKALQYFRKLADENDYYWQRQGNERSSNCYKLLARGQGNSPQKEKWYQECNRCRRECIVSAVKLHLRNGKASEIEKVSVKDLFCDSIEYTDDRSSTLDQVKRLLKFYKRSLGFMSSINQAYRGRDINDAFKKLLYNFLDLKSYYDCLDLATILVVTDIPDIEKVAVEVMMDIVEQTADQIDKTDLVKTCFERAMLISYNVNDVDSHVRVIYDITTCKVEADLIKELLVEVGLKVTKNQEDIIQFKDKTQALLTAMSFHNIVVLCIFKNNNTNLVEDYPINTLPQDQPVIIPLVVNSSQVSPVLCDIPSFKFQGRNHSKRTWLKEFGNRVFKTGAKI